MSVLVVGMSHRSAPVSLLERLSMDDGARREAIDRLVQGMALSEAMIVSTCNRLEVYTVANSFHAGVRDVVTVLQEFSGVDAATLRGYLYVRYADAAAEHMMVVTSGLDSMVVGEQQIIGQVRTAYQEATGLGTVGPNLHSLSQTALRTGKRVHSETCIDEAGASMVSFALDKAMHERGWSDYAGRRVLVLGAGAMASLAATHVGKAGAAEIVVANRTLERAERLVDHAHQAGVTARAVEFDHRAAALADVDVAISATGADGFTIGSDDLPADHELTLVDLSLPRDIDDAVADAPGVVLVNIESLHKSVTSRDSSSPEHRKAQRIVAEELATFTSEQRVRDVAPAVTALRRAAAEIAAAELTRLGSRVTDFTAEQRAEVTRTVHRVVDKLLHEPTVQAKRLAAESATLSYETALQQLFGLHTEPAPAVAVEVSQLPAADSLGEQ